VFRRIFVLGRTALPSVELVRFLAPDATVEVVAEALSAAARPEGWERWSPPGHAPLDANQLASSLGLKPNDLVVVGPLLRHSPRARAELAVRWAIQHGAYVLSVGQQCPAPTGAASHVAFISDGDSAGLEALAALLPRFENVAHVAGFLVRDGHARRAALEATLKAARPGRLVSVVVLTALPVSIAQAIDRAAVAADVDLVVAASDAMSDAAALVRGFFAADALQQAERPMLILPRTTPAPALLADRLASSDALVLPGAPAWVVVERNGPLGRVQLTSTDRIRWGERVLDHELGVVALWPDGIPEGRLSLAGTPQDRCLLRALSPTKPLLLVDARSPVEVLAPLELGADESHVVFVRLRWADALDALRKKLMERAPWAGVPTIIDASAWLGDGGANDVPVEVDPLRLRRLAARLRAFGACIRAVVGGAVELSHEGPEDFGAQECAGERIEGNEVLFELDNRSAREALLEAIAGARRTIHWQCYIVEEGVVAARFAQALTDAAGRGVKVRLLIDALYSRHDVFRARNPVIATLHAVEGIDVCAYRPVTGVPDLVALKQRNHRKLVVVDDEWAVVTGRNVGAAYYTSFGEVALTRVTNYREVPWLDCGVQVRGPIVAQVQRAFRASWIACGGSSFEPGAVPPPAGKTPCRLVLHDGLRDTNTFDTQLDLIRRARERIVAVNAFPFAVELQQALVDALRRGVRVEVLFGCARPKWGADQPFPGGVIRELADQLIRARLDPVLCAGGEVGELALEPLPSWERELGRVFPYVHAKILVRDGEEAAVGSANFDVTSAYWESEALLIVDEPATVALLLARLEPLLASARRADPADERWQREAEQRARLARIWPSLVG
jgi:cardiolipin synthase A/B